MDVADRKHRMADMMFRRLGLALAAVMASPSAGAETAPSPAPPRAVSVILDTDVWGDIDDVLALAMLHALDARGEARILAVTISTPDRWCAPFVDLVDTFYGRADIPIGVAAGNGATHPGVIPNATEQPNFTKTLATMRDRTGGFVFPHTLTDTSALPDAVALLRRTLAQQPDGSVVMIQIGYSTNLARLLDSAPDDASALPGVELVRRKVRLLSVMGGQFAGATYNGRRQPAGAPEFNLASDVPSSQRLLSAWPSPIVASGFETGLSIAYPGNSIARDFNYAANHPVAETYRYTEPLYHEPSAPPGRLHDHSTFDLTSVLYAVRPDAGYFSLSPPGRIVVNGDGSTRFVGNPAGSHRYLTTSPLQRARTQEAMVLLTSQPPSVR